MATYPAGDQKAPSTSGEWPSAVQQQNQHNYAANYWYFMQQPQQQSHNAQPTYDGLHLLGQPVPASNPVPGAAAAASDPWSQLANNFSHFQPSAPQHNSYVHQQSHYQYGASPYHMTGQPQSAGAHQSAYEGEQPRGQPAHYGAAYSPGIQFDDHQGQRALSGDSHQGTPDLVVAAGAEPLPESQSVYSNASVDSAEASLPDLWYGHARSNAQGPDVVASRPSDQPDSARCASAADESLDDVVLNGAPAAIEAPSGVVMDLDDYFQAPESDRPQSLVSAAGAIFSMAGGVHADQQHHVHHRQRSVEPDACPSQQSSRTCYSETPAAHSHYAPDATANYETTYFASVAQAENTSVVVEPVPPNQEISNEIEAVEADTVAVSEGRDIPIYNQDNAAETAENIELEAPNEGEEVEADSGNKPFPEDGPNQAMASEWDDWDNSAAENHTVAADAVEADTAEIQTGVTNGQPLDPPQPVASQWTQQVADPIVEKIDNWQPEGVEADVGPAVEIEPLEPVQNNNFEENTGGNAAHCDSKPVENEEKWEINEKEFNVEAAGSWSNVDWDSMNRELAEANLQNQPRVIDAPLLRAQVSVSSAHGEPKRSIVGAPNNGHSAPIQPPEPDRSSTPLPGKETEPIPSSTSTSPKKRRQESLHRRFQEASAKSKLALERLQREKGLLGQDQTPPVQPTVNLWATANVSKAKPVLLMPAKPANVPKSQSGDISKSSGILKKEANVGKENRSSGVGSPPEEEESPVERGGHRRPSSRSSAYEGYSQEHRKQSLHEYDHRRDHASDWYRSYYKRRPYSRASDHEDWRYYQYGERYRPRSTQSYAGEERGYDDEDEEDKENEGEDENSENGSDYYDDKDERRELEAYYRRSMGHPRRYHDYYRYQHAYQYYNQQPHNMGSFDPAWQQYIMEYYRYYGQYPTYDQLHHMWGEQQKRGQQKGRHGQQQVDAQKQQIDADGKTSLAQQMSLFPLQYGSGDSQASMSRAKTDPDLPRLAEPHGSEKSFEIRSELSSNVSGIQFAPGSATGKTHVEKIREPMKHSLCHAICRFGAGGHLILVTSNGGIRTAATHSASKTVEIRNLRTYLSNAECQREMEKIEKFPGPLSPKDTTKLAVVQFCQKKLDELGKFTADDNISKDLTDRESVMLVWRFLLLCVRQNGAAMGNDLAQLLLETRSESVAEMDEFTGLNWQREVERETVCPPTDDNESLASAGRGAGMDGSTDDQVDDQIYGDASDKRRRGRRTLAQQAGKGGLSACDRTLFNCSTQTTDLVEFKFRQLLLGGNKKEALEWAIKYRLWGHALFLAMKVDQRTHTNVMTRFANSLALNDPLQTLYQMLSGGTPYSVTRIPDEKWGDWRPHLAMILSNLTPSTVVAPDSANYDAQVHRQQEQQQQEYWSILTMGKTLMGAGRPYAAHFCFLCCHMLAGWDVFSPTPGEEHQNPLVSLIGAYDDENEAEIFTLDRYQCTEVYEYAIGLRNQQQQLANSLPSIQKYKWQYTLRLAEYGYREETYRYLYQLYSAIQAYPQSFTASFAKTVYEVAGKLQQFDPTVETIGSSLRSWQQPQWLSDLAALAGTLEQWTQSQPQQGTTAGAEQEHYQGQHSNQVASARPANAPVEYQPQNMVNQDPPIPAASAVGSRHSSIPRDWERQSSYGHGDPYDPSGQQYSNFLINTYNREEYDPQSVGGSPVREVRSSSVASQPESVALVTSELQPMDVARMNRSYADVTTTQQHHRAVAGSGQSSPSAVSKQPSFQQPDYWDSTAGGYYGGPAATRTARMSVSDQQRPDPAQTPMVGPMVMTETSPQSVDFGTPGSDNVFGVNSTPMHQMPRASVSHQQWTGANAAKESTAANKLGVGGEVKSAPAAIGKEDKSKRNASWFGRTVGNVIYKIMPKGPNEMILPDDKNKRIIWDADKQRWVNLDGGEDDGSVAAAPPPKDFQLASQADVAPSSAVSLGNPVPIPTGAAAGGASFLEQAYQQARQMQPAAPSQSQPQPQQQNAVKLSSAMNRYRKNESRRYVDVFGGVGGGGPDASLAPPWPPSDVGNANVFTPVGNADES